jgi:hypothetical protein
VQVGARVVGVLVMEAGRPGRRGRAFLLVHLGM